MPAPSSSDPPPSVIVRFEGDDQTSVGNQGVPPDAQIATGPNHVVEAINFELKVYNKQGTLIQTSGLAFFFNFPGGDAISDPSIMFDVLSGRWFASMFDQPGNFVKVVQRLPVRIELMDYDPDKVPLFIGLVVVLPVLGHATWHLYRRIVAPVP